MAPFTLTVRVWLDPEVHAPEVDTGGLPQWIAIAALKEAVDIVIDLAEDSEENETQEQEDT
jgi:hypothetical protein